ncbi:MAG: metallopeptidase family protein [Candidatus Nealsonbacteria bacterium]|nr:metallopeptidase family protein [Candidatus Nealsonbacteria bacterium]
MTENKFREIVKQGIEAIPERFLEKLKNIDIVIEDEPSSYQLSKLNVRKGSFILGLYEGVPQTNRWHYGQVLPDKITIFRKPITKMARSEQEVKEIVKNTVWHEIAHHFGMDERRIRRAEIKRKI